MMMSNMQDVDADAHLLEDGSAAAETVDLNSVSSWKEAAQRRKYIRNAQYLLVFNLGVGLLLGLVVASFCFKCVRHPKIPQHYPRITFYVETSIKATTKLSTAAISGAKWKDVRGVCMSLQAWSGLPLDAAPSSACFPSSFCLGISPFLRRPPHLLALDA